jgi:N-acetylglucosaminyldiphosphoundecaprenol N-acetyl-beta-D-mannosaminyltransferase
MASLFGQDVFAHGMDSAVEAVMATARDGGRGYGCLCNVHMIMEQRRNQDLAESMSQSTWVFPDGRPVALGLRMHGHAESEQIAGPVLMEACCRRAARDGIPIFLHGGTQEALDRLGRILPEHYPGLIIAGSYSPPFAPLTDESLAEDAQRIAESGARITFIGLGCPKPEVWMLRNRERIPGAMLGVGAAFNMHAGLMPRAPGWMVQCYLEWLHRFAQEPRRLWRRYLQTNPAFLFRLSLSLIQARLFPRRLARGGAA